MRPRAADVHINTAITNLTIGHRQSAEHFVAEKAFPRVPVEHKSDSYFTLTAADFQRDEVQIVAPGAPAPGGDFAMSNATYTCQTRKLKYKLPREVSANQDPGANLEIAIAEWLANKALIAKERYFATNHFATSKWGTDKTFTAGTTWDVAAGSDPIADVLTGHETVLKAIGSQANKLIVGVEVHNALTAHPAIQERIKYVPNDLAQNPSMLPAVYKALAGLFEVGEYMVSRGVYDSAVEGETAVPSYIAGKNALLVYVAPNPSILLPSGGYTFAWRKYGNGGWVVREWYDPDTDSDMYELAYCEDQKLTASAAGYFFSGAHA